MFLDDKSERETLVGLSPFYVTVLRYLRSRRALTSGAVDIGPLACTYRKQSRANHHFRAQPQPRRNHTTH